MLETTDFMYYRILFTLWKLAVDCADLLGYDKPSDPLDMHTAIVHVGEWSFVRVELIAYDEWKDCEGMREILQECLVISLLPESGIPPYLDGETTVGGLYMFNTFYGKPEEGKLVWEVLYVNNAKALELYHKEENQKVIEV